MLFLHGDLEEGFIWNYHLVLVYQPRKSGVQIKKVSVWIEIVPKSLFWPFYNGDAWHGIQAKPRGSYLVNPPLGYRGVTMLLVYVDGIVVIRNDEERMKKLRVSN